MKRNDDIELVTASPASENESNNRNKNSRKANDDDENNDSDYDSNTEVDLDSPVSNQCRSDEIISCPNDPHHKICEVHLCDGTDHCPDGADENPENCPQGEPIDFVCEFFFGKPKKQILSINEAYSDQSILE